MKTILINTPAAANLEKHDAPNYPHIGLGYIAAFLEQRNEKVEVIDAKLQRLNIAKVMQILRKKEFDLIGITAMTHDIMQAVNLATEIKKVFPNKEIVIGGVHATALPRETLEDYNCFDLAVFGEGEHTFSELIEALSGKKRFEEVKGLAFRKGKQVIVNEKRLWINNLDKLPFPAWHLFPKAKEYHIMTARGCPYSCIFCMSPYGRMIRERSPENTIREIEWVIKTYNPEILKFNDETFGFNPERANKILDLIIERKLTATKKVASMRANKVNFELLKKMKYAGFYYIDYGVESGDRETLIRIKKGVTLEQTENAVKMTKRAGIKVGVNVILGHPYETKETAMKTINYAVKLNGGITAIGIMVPYPGTEVAELARKGEGGYKILSQNWADYNKQFGNALELENLSRAELERLQLIGYLKIYLYNFRFLDLLKFIIKYRKAGFLILKKQLKNLFGLRAAKQ